jgi:hypothetical protein
MPSVRAQLGPSDAWWGPKTIASALTVATHSSSRPRRRRVRPDFDPLPGGEPGRTQVVEQYERPDHGTLPRWQEPPDRMICLVDIVPQELMRERAATHEATVPRRLVRRGQRALGFDGAARAP